MHPSAPQVPQKECVLAARVLEPVREDRQAVRSEVAGGEVAVFVGGLGETAVPREDARGDLRRGAEEAPEDVPQ